MHNECIEAHQSHKIVHMTGVRSLDVSMDSWHTRREYLSCSAFHTSKHCMLLTGNAGELPVPRTRLQGRMACLGLLLNITAILGWLRRRAGTAEEIAAGRVIIVKELPISSGGE